MKAVIVNEFGSADSLEMVEMEVPSYSAHQVLIKSFGASVNFADVKTRLGAHGKKKPPYIPGIDVMGEVEAVGAAVADIKPGDRVIAFPLNGSYAEYTVAEDHLTFILPADVDISTAIASPIVSFTSHFLLNYVTNLQRNESVLIHSAAGGVGLVAVQMAKLKGAAKIIGTVGTDSKKQAVLDAGADVVIHIKENIANAVKEHTQGKGVDVILDSVSGKKGAESLTALADYGRMAVFGNLSGEHFSVNTGDITASCRSVLGFSFGSTRVKRPELLKEVGEEVIAMLQENKLRIPVSSELPFDEVRNAHRLLEDRKAVGKIILRMN